MKKSTVSSTVLLLMLSSYVLASPLPQNSTNTSLNSSTTALNSSNDQDFTQFFADLINKFSISNSSNPSDIPDFIRSSKFSPFTNLKSFSEKIVDIQESSSNSTVFIDCDLKLKKSLKNSKVFAFKNCDPGKVLVNENFTNIFDIFPSAFLVTFEVQGDVIDKFGGQHGGSMENLHKNGLESSTNLTKVNSTLSLKTQEQVEHFSSTEVEKIEQNFDNFHRSILILIYEGIKGAKSIKLSLNSSKSDPTSAKNTQNLNKAPENPENSTKNPQKSPKYSTYLIESSKLTHLKNSNNNEKFSLANFITSLDSQLTNSSIIYYYDKITESLTNNCPICLRTLQLLNLKSYLLNLEIPNGNQLRKFHCDIDCFRALLITPTDFNFTIIPEYISILLHEKFINSLRMKTSDVITMNENATVDEFMEDHSVTMELEGLTTFAFLQKQFKVLEFLIRADCPYPLNFTNNKENSRMFPKKNRFVQKLVAHKDKIEKFHKDIKVGDIEGVRRFLSENKDIKFARNEENKSALKVAFENDQLEIYAMLKSHGMMMSSLEEIVQKYKKINDLNESEKTLIRHSNYKLLTPVAQDDNNYIEKLIQKSKFNFDPSLYTRDQIITEIRRAFIDVNNTTPEILEICSKSEDLVIIFDFDYAVIDEFEPGSTAVGLTQRQYDYVVIAANEFLSQDKNERNYALGTLSHELMHYAIFLVYDNDAYPYLKDDLESKNAFKNFTEKCKKFEKIEPHLAYPDGTEPDDFHIELIARVPDVLLMRQNLQLSLEIIKTTFSELFDFYYGKILQDIREMTATMRDREKVREVNQWLDVVREIEEFQVEVIVKDAESDCKKDENKNNDVEDNTDESEERTEDLQESRDDSAGPNEVQILENIENSTKNTNQTQDNVVIGQNSRNGNILESQEADDYFEAEESSNYSEHNENDIHSSRATNLQDQRQTLRPDSNINSTTTTQTTFQTELSTQNPNTILEHSNTAEDDNIQNNNIPAFIETTTTTTKLPTIDEDYLESGDLDDLKTQDTSYYDDEYEDQNNSNYFKKRKPIEKKRFLKRSSKNHEEDMFRSLKRSDYLVETKNHIKVSKRLKKSLSKLSKMSENFDETHLKEVNEKNEVNKVLKNSRNIERVKNYKILANSNKIDSKLPKSHSRIHQRLSKRSVDAATYTNYPQNLQDQQNLQNNSTFTPNLNLDTFVVNLGFELSSNQTYHTIFTNFPKAILKFIHKKVTNQRQLAVFMKLSSGRLDNFHKFMNDISNLNSEVLIVIECDDTDYLSGFVETLKGYSFKHVIFVADSNNVEDFENYEDEMEIRQFSVLWDDLCPKGQDYLTSYTFYFQNDEIKLGQIIGKNESILNKLAIKDIYNQDIYSIATDSVPENKEFYVERRLIDEDGRMLGMNKVVSEIFELAEEEEVDSNDERDEDEDEEGLKKLGKVHGLSKGLNDLDKVEFNEDQLSLSKSLRKIDQNLRNEEKSSNIGRMSTKLQIYSKTSVNPSKIVKNPSKIFNTSSVLKTPPEKFIKSTQKFQKYHKNSTATSKPFLEFKSNKLSANVSKMSPKSIKMINSAQKSTKSAKKSTKTGNFIVDSGDGSLNAPENPSNSSNPQNFQVNFKNPRNYTTFILTSPPGSGKSTTLKEMASKIREISPTLWVAYANLSEIDLTSNFSSEDILTFLTENVLKLSELDAVVFSHLFAEQRVVVLFDEFAKIDEMSKENCLKIFKFCELNSITIWISTRPSNLHNLQNNLVNQKIFKLSEFLKSDTEKFLEFFDESRESEILEFLDKVGKVGNPKMIHEIAEVFESHQNVTNWYSIYTQLILNRNFERSAKAQETNDIEEALSSPQKLLKAHQFEALNYLYPNKIIATLNLTFESTDMLEHYELIYKNSANETKFLHDSFASYFVAQYFAENLLKIKVSKINFENNWKILLEATKFKSWRVVEKFLNDFIEINENKVDSRMDLKIRNILKETRNF